MMPSTIWRLFRKGRPRRPSLEGRCGWICSHCRSDRTANLDSLTPTSSREPHPPLRRHALARSLPDARDIADELTIKGVALSLGGSVYDPNDPVGRLLFNALGMVAEFEADLIRLRTREGMAIARSKGKLKGKKPKLSPSQRKHLLTLHAAGEHTQAELAELFNVSRTTIYRELRRTTIDT